MTPATAIGLGRILVVIAGFVVALAALVFLVVLIDGPTTVDRAAFDATPDWAARLAIGGGIMLTAVPLAGILAGIGALVQVTAAKHDL
jgi:hypothetical protein